jgi:hypothetical protein
LSESAQGAAAVAEGDRPEWLDRFIDGSDFHGGVPNWEDRNSQSSDQYVKRWSEETAARVEQDGEVTRVVLFEPE